MIKIEKTEVFGWEAAIRGMRNPKNSWDRMDTVFCGSSPCSLCNYDNDIDRCEDITDGTECKALIGPNDHKLMMDLASGGPVHAKYRRMIVVYVDVTAPMFWWKEYDTYKVGTVRNSCSTMHKIHVKPFEYDDFAHEGVDDVGREFGEVKGTFLGYINTLEWLRNKFNETQEKRFWRALIEMLPDGFQMKATLMLNYEVLAGIYPMRRSHKLDEWHEFCRWIESLPYSEIITGEDKAFEFDEDEAEKFIEKILEKNPNAFDRVYPISAKELKEALELSEKKEE